jgi:hypothetical protein
VQPEERGAFAFHVYEYLKGKKNGKWWAKTQHQKSNNSIERKPSPTIDGR